MQIRILFCAIRFTLLDDFVPLLLIKLTGSWGSHRLQREGTSFTKQVPVAATSPNNQQDQDDKEPHF